MHHTRREKQSPSWQTTPTRTIASRADDSCLPATRVIADNVPFFIAPIVNTRYTVCRFVACSIFRRWRFDIDLSSVAMNNFPILNHTTRQ